MDFLINHLFEIFIIQNGIGSDLLEIGTYVCNDILQCQIAGWNILM